MEVRINMAFIIVDSFGFAELPKFMMTLEGKQNEIQTELAVHIADRYILMHECDEGYDYSIMDEQYYRDEFLRGGVHAHFLLNYCAHHSMVVDMASTVVIPDNRDSKSV